MTDDGYDLDRALETATQRTKEAEADFVSRPPEDPEALAGAVEVEQRAEELAILSDEALNDRLPPTGSGDPADDRDR